MGGAGGSGREAEQYPIQVLIEQVAESLDLVGATRFHSPAIWTGSHCTIFEKRYGAWLMGVSGASTMERASMGFTVNSP